MPLRCSQLFSRCNRARVRRVKWRLLGADGGLGCRYLSEVRKLTADVSIEVGTLGRCSHELVVDRLRYAEILVDGAAPKLQRQLSGDWIVSGGGKRGGLVR